MDQWVYLATHTYQFKHYHGPCEYAAYYYTQFKVEHPTEGYLMNAKPGTVWDKFYMQAGESMTLNVFTHFDEGDLLPHDWSVSAWAELEEVSISVDDLASDSFFFVERDESIPVPQEWNDLPKYTVVDRVDNDDIMLWKEIIFHQTNEKLTIVGQESPDGIFLLSYDMNG